MKRFRLIYNPTHPDFDIQEQPNRTDVQTTLAADFDGLIAIQMWNPNVLEYEYRAIYTKFTESVLISDYLTDLILRGTDNTTTDIARDPGAASTGLLGDRANFIDIPILNDLFGFLDQYRFLVITVLGAVLYNKFKK